MVGNLPAFGRDPLSFLSRCAGLYGDVVGVRLGTWPALLLNHPDLAEQVLVTHNRSFVKHRFFWRHIGAVFGEGLLTSERDVWLRERRLVQPAFHRDRITTYGRMMVELSEQTATEWKRGASVDIHAEMMKLTLRIVVRTLFGVDAPQDVTEMGNAIDIVVKEIAARFRRPFRIPDGVPTPGNIRYRRAIRMVDRFIARVVAERREKGKDRGDLLSMLLAAQDVDGTSMTDRQVRDEAVTLFLAGHETTALALSWTWMLLAQNPSADAKLTAELGDVLGDRLPTPDDISRLTYTQAIVQESLRLYPPAWVIGREAASAVDLNGLEVPIGTTVFVSPWVLHRDRRFYDQPEIFRPERWLNEESRARLPRLAYLPFGAGPRVCVGSGFAMTEAVLVLATLARQFRPTQDEARLIPPFPTITLRPAEPMWMRLDARES